MFAQEKISLVQTKLIENKEFFGNLDKTIEDLTKNIESLKKNLIS